MNKLLIIFSITILFGCTSFNDDTFIFGYKYYQTNNEIAEELGFNDAELKLISPIKSLYYNGIPFSGKITTNYSMNVEKTFNTNDIKYQRPNQNDEFISYWKNGFLSNEEEVKNLESISQKVIYAMDKKFYLKADVKESKYKNLDEFIGGYEIIPKRIEELRVEEEKGDKYYILKERYFLQEYNPFFASYFYNGKPYTGSDGDENSDNYIYYKNGVAHLMRYNNYESEDLLKENYYSEITSISKDTIEDFSEMTIYSEDSTYTTKFYSKKYFEKIDNEYFIKSIMSIL